MSTIYDDPHWFGPKYFRDRGKHTGILKIVRDTCNERLRGSPDAGEDSLIYRSDLKHRVER